MFLKVRKSVETDDSNTEIRTEKIINLDKVSSIYVAASELVICGRNAYYVWGESDLTNTVGKEFVAKIYYRSNEVAYKVLDKLSSDICSANLDGRIMIDICMDEEIVTDSE